MCGIAALFGTSPVDRARIERMTKLVAHRGPDGEGTLALLGGKVQLGHRRLAIIDLSDAGLQPMAYRDRFHIVFNGEIYNHVELRASLEKLGHTFRSHSDTEVILAAFAEWGPACFARLRGMWGLVLVDTETRRAWLSRDRLGIKPLYVRRDGDTLAVASEIKQLEPREPEEESLLAYLDTGYEDTSRTFFRGVSVQPAGTWSELDLDTLTLGAPRGYWHPERVAATVKDPREAARLLGESLRTSVKIHLRSDVPVGCALSGGLDSSALAALVASQQPVHTFTATFPGDPIDEKAWVDRVVAHTRATPHFVTPTPDGLLADLDRFVWIHDEPVGTASMYAGWCVARLTREAGVPVTLNGQGGDEILAGYWQSYFLHLAGLFRAGRLLKLAAHLGGAIAPGGNPELARQAPVMLRRWRDRRAAAAESAKKKLAAIMTLGDQARRLFEIREMYLPRLLKWDDRNFMAFSVEGRYPFLDHEVIETALAFAPEALYARGWTKEPLRRELAGLLPDAIVRRRTKLGFETPQTRWLRGPLKSTIERWLAGDSPLWTWVEPARARAIAAQAWASRDDEPSQRLFRLWIADRWLRRFF